MMALHRTTWWLNLKRSSLQLWSWQASHHEIWITTSSARHYFSELDQRLHLNLPLKMWLAGKSLVSSSLSICNKLLLCLLTMRQIVFTLLTSNFEGRYGCLRWLLQDFKLPPRERSFFSEVRIPFWLLSIWQQICHWRNSKRFFTMHLMHIVTTVKRLCRANTQLICIIGLGFTVWIAGSPC